MGEELDRTVGVVARTFGNTVNPVVYAVMTAAGIVTGDPILSGAAIPGAAAAGVLAEEAVMMAQRAWKAEGVGKFANEVERATGKPMEDTLTELRGDRPKRMLLGEAAASAAGSADDWKIRTLARAFVAGADDGARVDEMRLLVSVLAEVEVADVRFLAAVQKAAPTGNYDPTLGSHSVEYNNVLQFDHGLNAVGPLLMAKGVRLGYVGGLRERNFHMVHLTEVGRTVCQLLTSINSMPK